MLSDMGLVDCLDCTSYSGLRIQAFTHLAKRAFAEDTSNLILLVKALRLFETLEHAELEYLLGKSVRYTLLIHFGRARCFRYI